jgi:hypothetical protein
VTSRRRIQYLVEILKTPIGEVTVDHRLAQSYDAKSGKIELPNKLGAMQLLAKMCGCNEPEKHEFEHGYKAQQDLVEVIARLSGAEQPVCWIKLARSRTFVLPKLGESRLPQAALFPPILPLPNITLDHSRHSQL